MSPAGLLEGRLMSGATAVRIEPRGTSFTFAGSVPGCFGSRRWMSVRRLLLTVLVLIGCLPATSVYADEIRPALLDIKEQNTGLFAVTWKVPTRGEPGAGYYPAYCRRAWSCSVRHRCRRCRAP